MEPRPEIMMMMTMVLEHEYVYGDLSGMVSKRGEGEKKGH
jgi:hypothetical protein